MNESNNSINNRSIYLIIFAILLILAGLLGYIIGVNKNSKATDISSKVQTIDPNAKATNLDVKTYTIDPKAETSELKIKPQTIKP